jgi:hypothetical protein
MRVLLFLLITAALLIAPFVALRKPWALRLWSRVKKLFWVYVIAITISAAFWLVLRWEDFYG